MPDAEFDDPRLARLTDPFDPDRTDLDAYVALAVGLGHDAGVRRVLDVGCGTGTLALRLVDRGFEVTGLDPAGASLDLARAKPGADRVRWLLGDATTLEAPGDGGAAVRADLATMTANVAQVFLTEAALDATLRALHAVLAPGGHLCFESRVPAARAWERWTPEHTTERRTVEGVPGVGTVTTWCELLEVDEPRVTFRWTNVLEDGDDAGLVLRSVSTLRFWTLPELEAALRRTGFDLVEVRDAPDRPGREHVVLARTAAQVSRP